MAQYNYQGVDKRGKRVSGKIDAPTEGDLRMVLRSQGIRPVRVVKAGALNADLGALFGKNETIPLEILVTFTRQLQVLISSGIPIVQGLEVLADQALNRGVKTILTALKEKVSGGTYLWEAMSAYPKAFPKLYVALMRAGESSGSLDQMLKRLSRYLEDANRLRKTIKGAMMYPIIVILIAIGVIAVMLGFVIPKFEELLTSSGQSLPLPTQVVINLSHFVVHNALYLIVGAVLGSYIVIRYVSSPEGKAVLDRALFKTPLFGNLMQKAGTARFSRTMQTLLSSGVNLIDAVDICKATVDNAVLEEAVGKIRADIEAGKTLGMVVGRLPAFPKMAAQMIAIGESTGNLDKMLEKVADFYEEEVEAIVAGMTKLIEPIMIVVLGGMVGGLMIAMYLPIFKMAGAAGQ